MGNATSRVASTRSEGRETTLIISAPENVQIQIPRNRLDENGMPIQPVSRTVDRGVLLAALDHVSAYIAQRHQHVSINTTGGAVSTLHLGSRSTTHDVDVFGSDFHNDARILVDDAMWDAQNHVAGLGTEWLNTEIQLWMPGPLHAELTVAAREQNTTVYDGPGLTIFAAPWEYAFSGKISRILTGGDQIRPYDLSDAVCYIHQYIRATNNQPVSMATALGWAEHYGHHTNEDFLRTLVNTEYRRQYGAGAFV
ncbi:hypothetical protein QQZ08_004620 [Neonectria magnoliae]|uniref:DUF7582 domain-containing protein n=1 Tax=Neonectria magnoliae TaxID=2732573 RepID=A0ABR1I5P3_9HYPO